MTITRAELVFDRFDEIMNQYSDEADREVDVTLHQIEAQTKRLAPVDQGVLRNSYQTEKTGTAQGAVFTNQAHGPPQEYGTYKMAAQPHLGPAAEAQRQPFINRLTQIGRRLH